MAGGCDHDHAKGGCRLDLSEQTFSAQDCGMNFPVTRKSIRVLNRTTLLSALLVPPNFNSQKAL